MTSPRCIPEERLRQEAIARFGLRPCSSRWPSRGALCLRDHVIAYFTDDTIDIRITRAGIRLLSADVRNRAVKLRKDWIELPLDTDEQVILELLSLSKRHHFYR
jgi:hypothetical protein